MAEHEGPRSDYTDATVDQAALHPVDRPEPRSTDRNQTASPRPGTALALAIGLAALAAVAGCKKDANDPPSRIPKVYTPAPDRCGGEERTPRPTSPDRRKSRPANSPTLMPHVEDPDDTPQPPAPPEPEAQAPNPPPLPPEPEEVDPAPLPAPSPPPEPPEPETPETFEKLDFSLAINFSPEGVPGQISITPPHGWEFELKTGASSTGAVEYLLLLKNAQTGQTATTNITPHMTRLLTSRNSRPLILETRIPTINR